MTSERTGSAHGILPVCHALAATVTGPANGLSSRLMEDLTATADPSRWADAPPPVVLRVVVLRTGASTAGLVPLLTGARLYEPAAVPGPVPLAHSHLPGSQPELRLDAEQRGTLDRLAWRLLRAATETPGGRSVTVDRYETVTWLRVRAAQGRRSFFRAAYAGEDAVARTWRRVQDVTSAGLALGVPAAETLTRTPVALAVGFAGEPLPWPLADALGVGVTVTDVPVQESAAGLRRARDLVDGAHLVIAAAPHAELSGREALPGPFRTLLAAAVGGPCHAPVALVSAVTHHRGLALLDGLGGWLRGAVPDTVGPAARGLPVYAVALPRARHALDVLLRPEDRGTPVVQRARHAWATSGIPALCSAVLGPALHEARTVAAELSTRRLRAALHDIRLEAGAGTGGASRTAEEALSRDVPPGQLWDELDRFVTVPLARRAVQRLERTDRNRATAACGADTAAQFSGPVPPRYRADHPDDTRGATRT
ncbi:hypothetical protein [Streptomyces sp. NPDC054794]